MPRYTYKARDEQGKQIGGAAEADTQEALAERLSRTGYLVTEIRAESAGGRRGLLRRLARVPDREYLVFAFHVSNALSAGVPLLQVLDTVSEQTKSDKLKAALRDVAGDLRAGLAFSQALRKQPNIFSGYLVSLVASGETTGKLHVALETFCDHLEAEMEFKGKITSAIAYPAVLACAAAGIVAFLMTYIMPKFITIFQEAKVPLPLPTRILVALTTALQRDWPWLAGLAMILTIAGRRYLATDAGRGRLDQLKLKLPVLGGVLGKIYLSRFMRTLALLYNSGVPILSSLKVVQETVGNRVFAEAIRNVSGEITEGQGISEPLRKTGLFPSDALMTIASGEQSGRLGEMLTKSSELFQKEVEYDLKVLTSLFEPLVVVTMGLIVGFVALAIMLPIFRMSKVAL